MTTRVDHLPVREEGQSLIDHVMRSVDTLGDAALFMTGVITRTVRVVGAPVLRETTVIQRCPFDDEI